VARHVPADSAELRDVWIIDLRQLCARHDVAGTVSPAAALPNRALQLTPSSDPD